jgi:hypothetical protein
MEFTKRDILNALGLESDTSSWSSALFGFGIGCVVGAAVTAMLTPKTGRELREDLMEKGKGLIGRQEMSPPRV